MAALRRLQARDTDFDTLLLKIRALTKGYVLSTPVLDPSHKIFRGVVWGQRPSKLEQLSYPPAHLLGTYGRANRPGRPMFYGSVSREAPFYEMRVSAGTHLAVARWSLTDKMLFNNVGYSTKVFRRFDTARQGLPWWQEKAPSDIETPGNRLVHRFLATEFARLVQAGNEHEYKTSAAIAEALLGNLILDDWQDDMPAYRGFGGLIYPSLAMRANSDNVAIRPEVVDRFMRIEQVEFIRVDSVNENFSYTITELDFANSVSPDGTIEWKGRAGHWNLPPGRKYRVSVENGHWVAHDEAGALVERE